MRILILLLLMAPAYSYAKCCEPVQLEDILSQISSSIESYKRYHSIEYCIYLTQRLGGLRGDYFDVDVVNLTKAKKYGELCILNGVNNTQAGWAVNIWLAAIHQKLHSHQKAKSFLKSAILLDKNGSIKELQLIKRYNLMVYRND